MSDDQDMGWVDLAAAQRTARRVAEMRRQKREEKELVDALAGVRLKLTDGGMSGLDDLGWGDPRAARSASRRLRLRYRLRDVQASTAALIDTIENGIDPDCDPAAALHNKAVDQVRSDGSRVVDDGRAGLVDSDDQREKNLLQGVDMVVQLFDALRSEIIHGAFSVRKKGEANPAPDAGHRLSGAAK